MEKTAIRHKIKELRRMLTELEKESAAAEVFARLEKTAAFMLADRILMYHSLPDELSTRTFLKKWGSRKHFYLPRVNGVNLEILPYEESRLELGASISRSPRATISPILRRSSLWWCLPWPTTAEATASDAARDSTTASWPPRKPLR